MWKIMVADHKNQPSHRNGVSQNALLGNCMYFIFRQMTFLRQNLAENRKRGRHDYRPPESILIITVLFGQK